MNSVTPREHAVVEVPSMKVALIGPPGVGKTALLHVMHTTPASQIDERLGTAGLQEVSAVQMRQLLRWHGYRGSDNLQDLATYHAQQRALGQNEAIFGQLAQHVNNLVIFELHHPEDIPTCRKLGVFTIGLEADFSTCHDRFIRDNNDEKHSHERANGDANHDLNGGVVDQLQAREYAWHTALYDYYGPSQELTAFRRHDWLMNGVDATVSTHGNLSDSQAGLSQAISNLTPRYLEQITD